LERNGRSISPTKRPDTAEEVDFDDSLNARDPRMNTFKTNKTQSVEEEEVSD
jgi:hypothetical protein